MVAWWVVVHCGPSFLEVVFFHSLAAFVFYFFQGGLTGYAQPTRVYNVAIRKFSEFNKLAISFFWSSVQLFFFPGDLWPDFDIR
jgi:hypothetical protein